MNINKNIRSRFCRKNRLKRICYLVLSRRINCYVNLKYLLLFLVLFLFAKPSISQDEVSLQMLLHLLSENSIDKVSDIAKKNSYLKKDGKRYIRLSNKVFHSTKTEILNPWRFIKLDNEQGFEVYIPTSYGYIDPTPTFDEYSVESCSYNIHSITSGTEFVRIDNGNLFIIRWSCGSAGCSYGYKYTLKNDPCFQINQ